MQVLVPSAKFQEVIDKIVYVLGRKKSVLKEIQSLIGSVNFCYRSNVAGRPFLRRLSNSICGLSKPFHHI